MDVFAGRPPSQADGHTDMCIDIHIPLRMCIHVCVCVCVYLRIDLFILLQYKKRSHVRYYALLFEVSIVTVSPHHCSYSYLYAAAVHHCHHRCFEC